jgi:hypothetical protein
MDVGGKGEVRTNMSGKRRKKDKYKVKGQRSEHDTAKEAEMDDFNSGRGRTREDWLKALGLR